MKPEVATGLQQALVVSKAECDSNGEVADKKSEAIPLQAREEVADDDLDGQQQLRRRAAGSRSIIIQAPQYETYAPNQHYDS